jgi:AmmeMemoRadiSam system protein B
MEHDDSPRVRNDIEILPTSYQGETVFVVRDTLGLIPQPVMLQEAGLSLLRLIDGRRTLQDIQLELIRRNNNLYVGLDAVRGMLQELDGAMLLDSPGYRQARDRLIDDFVRQPHREASLAGRSYPEDPQELKSELERLLEAAGHLSPDSVARGAAALVAPHIDLAVGGRVYGRAYAAVRNCSPKRVVLLGTGHHLEEYYFSVSSKTFDSPLGEVHSAEPWVEALKAAGGDAVCPHDFVHRSEHSLEFQLIFCQYLFGSSFSLVPILCGSFHPLLDRVSRPGEEKNIREFIAVLSRCVAEEPDTLVVAGVDFSHIGLKFGHSDRAAALLDEARAHDHTLLAALERGDIHGFWAESRRVQDRYNVCGLSALACLLELFPEYTGRLLDYDFWQEEPTQSAVSFAAVLMTGEEKSGVTHD